MVVNLVVLILTHTVVLAVQLQVVQKIKQEQVEQTVGM